MPPSSLITRRFYLLGKGAVLQAYRTFSDGIKALEGVVSSERTDLNVDAMVDRGLRRMLDCKPDCDSSPFRRMVFCDLSMPPSAKFLRSTCEQYSDTMTPIYIDLVEQHVSRANPNIELSILLYNAAITNFLLSRMHATGVRYQRHLNNTFRCLEFSLHLALNDETGYGCHSVYVCGLAIAYHAARSMIEVILSSQGPRLSDLFRYRSLLCEVRARLTHWQDQPMLALFSQATFAAAA